MKIIFWEIYELSGSLGKDPKVIITHHIIVLYEYFYFYEDSVG